MSVLGQYGGLAKNGGGPMLTIQPGWDAPPPRKCCWPMWEGGPPTQEFCCGPVVRGSYCAEHGAIAYVTEGREAAPRPKKHKQEPLLALVPEAKAKVRRGTVKNLINAWTKVNGSDYEREPIPEGVAKPGTEQQIAELYNRGIPTGEIGERVQLGKNAVCGLVFRMKRRLTPIALKQKAAG